MAAKTKTKGRKGSLVSIVINNEFIKICEATKTGKNITLHKAIVVPTPLNSYGDGNIRDRGALDKAIKVAFSNYGIVTDEVIFSVASSKIATKDVVIPNVKPKQIEGIVNANAAEYFPVNIEEHIVQYSVLAKVEEEGVPKLKLRVMAAPADMIEVYYDLAANLGVRIKAIDYVGNSSSQIMAKIVPAQTSAVIQVENDSTIVNIFSNNELQMQRIIPYGKSLVVNSVMNKMKLKYDDALKASQDMQLLHPTFDGDELTDNLRYLVGNINRIMDFYATRNQDKPIEKAFIVGNAVTIQGFVQLLSNELRLNLEPLDVFRDVVVDKKTYIDLSDTTKYILNIGAIIAPVNFQPKSRAQAAKAQGSSKNMMALFVGAVIISAFLVIFPLVQLLPLKTKLTQTENQIEQLKPIEAIVGDFYQAKDMYTDVSNFQTLSNSNNDTLEAFVMDLEDKIPSDVAFQSMAVNNGAVTFTGTASSKESVADLIAKLRSIEYVTGVTIGSEAESKDAIGVITVTFAMTCQISPKQ